MKRKFGMADKLGYMFGDFGNDFAFTVIFLLRQVTGSSPFPYSLLAVFGTSAHSATPCSASG